MVAQRQRYDDYDDHDNHADTEKTKKRVRMTFDVAPDLRRRIKLAALNHNLTLNEYLGQVLEEVVPVEEDIMQKHRQPVSREAIERLLQFRQELIKETNGIVFDDTAEILHEEREKRLNQLTGKNE